MIKIQNIYYMLAYAFRVLNEGKYSNLSSETFNNASNLFASILTKGITNQVKRGLGKKYVLIDEDLLKPRGKIDIAHSIKNQTMINSRLSCEFDELSHNITVNQILKSTAMLLIRTSDVSNEYKKALKKVLIYFGSVEEIKLSCVGWNHINYHRNNATYKMLINICYLVVEGLLLSDNEGEIKVRAIYDDQKLYRLYERFVLEYYRKHYPQLNAMASNIKWNVDDDFIQFLPVMRSDIMLSHNEKTLIIDTKYYQKTMQSIEKYDSLSVHSNNIYQIFTYVKNGDIQGSGNVSGMLLYAKTDEDITPDYVYRMGGNTIWVKTLDLNLGFEKICNQMDNIVCQWSGNDQICRYE